MWYDFGLELVQTLKTLSKQKWQLIQPHVMNIRGEKMPGENMDLEPGGEEVDQKYYGVKSSPSNWRRILNKNN